MRQIKLFIPGIPVAQARPRTRVVWPKKEDAQAIMKKISDRTVSVEEGLEEFKTRCWVQIYEPAESRNYKGVVRKRVLMLLKDSPYRSLFPLAIDLRVEMTCWIPRPKTVSRPYPGVSPDYDNYEKAVLDGVTGVLWQNDAIIIKGSCEKLYASTAQAPGVELTIRPYPDGEFPGSQESMMFTLKSEGENNENSNRSNHHHHRFHRLR